VPSLQKILNSPEIIKLGVGIDGDLSRLISENFVNPENDSFFDIRFLAAKSESCSPGGLASLVRQMLNRKLNKDLKIRKSNWEIENLSVDQIIYAADDALSALQIFAAFLEDFGEGQDYNLFKGYKKNYRKDPVFRWTYFLHRIECFSYIFLDHLEDHEIL